MDNDDEANKNHPAVPLAYLESASSHEPLAKGKGDKMDKRCSIHVHSRTHRLSDCDGRSFKAALDGIVNLGILPDDDASIISQTSQTQERVTGKPGNVAPEETIIEIIWE